MRAIDRRWTLAINEWQSGRSDALVAELDRLRLPQFAHEFLSDLALGKVQKDKGRPPNHTGAAERDLLCAVFAEWDRLKVSRSAGPRETAIASVAALNKMSEDAVRRIMEKQSKNGWTLDFWRRNLKPKSK